MTPVYPDSKLGASAPATPKKHVQTAATPAIGLTIGYNDAYNLSQGSVWSEMGIVQQVEALLAKAVAQVQSGGLPVHMILTVDNK